MTMTKDVAKNRIGPWAAGAVISFGMFLWLLATMNHLLTQGPTSKEGFDAFIAVTTVEMLVLMIAGGTIRKTMQCLAVLLER